MKDKEEKKQGRNQQLSRSFVALLADEVAKTIVKRLPGMLPRHKKKKKNGHRIEKAIFLDTSAIIDGRIFDVISLKLLDGLFVILESILLELKHIADSKEVVKRERGRKGLDLLEKLKKTKGVKVIVYSNNHNNLEVDEQLIATAKENKGKVVTCDYNLEKKATISGVTAINVNTLANFLKVIAVPGEVLNIKILHKGKDVTQGVGYLDDGTMLVVENASNDLGKSLDVIVARVIQTSAGRILFAKKI